MNTEYEYTPSQDKSFIPLTLLSISVISFFVWQCKDISQKRESIVSNKTKLEDFVQTNVPKLDEQVAKSKQAQDVLQKLVEDLLDISKTDPDAKAIINKYNIHQQTPSGSAAPATP